MPIYEYRCPHCGEVFERFVRSVYSQEPVRCPRCGNEETERILSAFHSGGASAVSSGSSGCGSGGFS
ncbi:MAG: zinc ribbon domain-containing protein [candidate division KSB1 bacterium]|nr:zinc ribbon domain-containing protein [candidate division KSB1 bacterium]